MTKLKQTALALGTACALVFTGGIAALNAIPANAETARTSRKYYGAKLSDEVAGAFYDELVAMTVDPDGDGEQLSAFRSGASHTVTNQTILDAAAGYVNDGANLDKQFGAALDSFRYDYADIFYVDFDLLDFTVTEKEAQTPDPSPDEGTETDPQAEEGAAEYTVTIGAGRADSYFMYDLTAEELNKEKNADDPSDKGGLFVQYTAAKTALTESVQSAVAGASSVREKAVAVNKLIGEKFRYGYDFNSDGLVSGVDRFVGTTGSIVTASATAKCYANSEGLARVYKMLMNELNITCELVSGYSVSGNTVKAGMWNYVQDGSEWFAVDVAGNLSSGNKYLCLTGEIFSLDHFEDRVVSLSNYKLSYPVLTVKHYNVETGEIQIANGVYEEREGIAVSYLGDDGKLAFRILGDDGVWSEWTKFEDFMLTDGPEASKPETPETPEITPEALAEDGTTPDGSEGADGAGGEVTPPEEGEPETPDPEEPDPAPVYNIAEKDGIYYLFNLTDKKFQIGILNADGACVEYSETVKESFGTGVVPIPIEANPERAEAQDITQSLNVAITYPIDMKKSGAEDTAIEYTVSSIFGDSVNEEFVKQNSKVENVIWSSDSNTLSFTFTPSSLLEHNGLRYSFVPTNLISVETEAVPHPYSVIFKFNGIKASGVFAGGNFYTDVVTQPSLVYNNDLSLAGWTYGNDAGGTSAVTENMRSALALSVSRPVSGVDSAISDAAKAKIANSSDLFLPNAYLANVNYLLDLTLEGRAVTVPDGSYLKLAFPYPEGYGPETSNVAYRVLKFGKNEQGVIDYENCEIIEAIPLRQGIIASVNSFSAFALVAIDSGKIISPYANSSPRTVFTMTSGIGGTVTTNSNNAINTVQKNGDTIVYTFTADEGYEIGFVTLNGEDAKSVNRTSGEGEPATYRFSIAYGELQINNKPAANNVLHVEFVAIAAKDTVELEKTAAKQFVLKQFSGEAYSEAEKNEIVRDYPAGGAIFTPSLPPIVPGPEVFDPSSTQMQLIIVLGVVAAFAVIGAIAIVYCAAIRPKIIREREEEAARIAANRERRANRNRIKPTNNLPPRDPQNPAKR